MKEFFLKLWKLFAFPRHCGRDLTRWTGYTFDVISGTLESGIRLLENILVISWMVLSIWVVASTVHGAWAANRHPLDGIQKLSANWLIVIFLVIPLIYRSLRKVIDEIQEFAGVKRKPQEKVLPAEDPKTSDYQKPEKDIPQ